MTREDLNNKIEHLMEALENTQRSIQFTNIPVYALINYIKDRYGTSKGVVCSYSLPSSNSTLGVIVKVHPELRSFSLVL